MSDIDPLKFGQMSAEVEGLKTQVAELRADVKSLLELANQSKGGFWMGMVVASSAGAFVSWIVSHMPWAFSRGG